MRTPTITHLSLLLCGFLTLGSTSSLEAEERRFRLRIPNPIPRIVDRIGKVGDFVGRTARKIGQDEESEERRRTTPQPPEPEPVSPPDEDLVTDPRYLERERDPYSPRQNEIDRRGPTLATPALPSPSPTATLSGDIPVSVPVPASARARPQTPASKIVVVAPSTDPTVQESNREPVTPSAANRPMASDPTLAAAPGSEDTEPTPTKAPSEPTGPTFGRPVPGRPGLVYPPGAKMTAENRVDVRDIPPGTKVRDPSTGQIFLVP